VLNNPINANDPSGHKCVGEPEECKNNGKPINTVGKRPIVSKPSFGRTRRSTGGGGRGGGDGDGTPVLTPMPTPTPIITPSTPSTPSVTPTIIQPTLPIIVPTLTLTPTPIINPQANTNPTPNGGTPSPYAVAPPIIRYVAEVLIGAVEGFIEGGDGAPGFGQILPPQYSVVGDGLDVVLSLPKVWEKLNYVPSHGSSFVPPPVRTPYIGKPPIPIVIPTP
jgi:hypothetical protein